MRENKQTNKQEKGMDKNLKIEIKTIKKTQIKEILEMENLDKWKGTVDMSITNRLQTMSERILAIEDSIKEID